MIKEVCIVNLSTQDSTGLNPNHNSCDTDWLCLVDYLQNIKKCKVYLHNPYVRKKLFPWNIKVNIISTEDMIKRDFDEVYLNFQPYMIRMAAGHGIRPFMVKPEIINWLYREINKIYCLYLDVKPGSTPPLWEYSEEWDIEHKLRRDRCSEDAFHELKYIFTERIIPICTSQEMLNQHFKNHRTRKGKLINLYETPHIWNYILRPEYTDHKFYNLSYVGFNITPWRKQRLEYLSKDIKHKITFGRVTLNGWTPKDSKTVKSAQDNIDIMSMSRGQLITYDHNHPMLTLRIYQSVVAQSLILLDEESPLNVINKFKNIGIEHQIISNSKDLEKLINSSEYDKLIEKQNKAFNYGVL